MRTFFRVAMIVVAALVLFKVAGWLLRLAWATVALGLRLVVTAALVLAVVYGYRRLTRGRRERTRKSA